LAIGGIARRQRKVKNLPTDELRPGDCFYQLVLIHPLATEALYKIFFEFIKDCCNEKSILSAGMVVVIDNDGVLAASRVGFPI
jgi:hypothetical protein